MRKDTPEILVRKLRDALVIPNPSSEKPHTDGIETFARYFPKENRIILTVGGNRFRSERSIVHTLCHEVNHWAQYLEVEPSEYARLGKDAVNMLERAANWGICPTYELNIQYHSARAVTHPEIVGRRFVRILKGEGHK